jgi:hypothetical protein
MSMTRYVRTGGLLLVVVLSTLAFTQETIDRILVLKSEHRLILLRGTEIVKSYAVALGSGGPAPNRRQGIIRRRKVITGSMSVI